MSKEYIGFVLSDASGVLDQIRDVLKENDYTSKECSRYVLLIEEGLIKWKENIGDIEARYIINENKKNICVKIIVEGIKCYPFDSSEGEKDYLGQMRDRLLSGTGIEINYKYRHGENQIILTLPKKEHEHNIFKMNVWALALPGAMQYLFTNIITATDSILMGILDQNSLAAISITGSFMSLYNILITALTVGTTIFVSQYWGKRDWRGINEILSVSLRYSMLCSIVFFIPSFVCPRWVMSIYTNIPELIDIGSSYLRIVSATFLCIGIYQINDGILKNTGRVIKCTIFFVSSALVNLILDFILIFGLFGFSPMGIKGAAIGTLISAVLHLILSVTEFVRDKNIHIAYMFSYNLDIKQMLHKFFSKSYPVVIQMITWTVADNICTSIFGHMDTDVIAANGIINIVQKLGVFAMAGLYETCGILIGSKLGSGELDAAKTYSKRYMRYVMKVGIITFVGVFVLNFFVEYLPLSLTSKAFYYLHILLIVEAFEMFFLGLNNIMNYGAFYAGGDTKFLMVIDTVNMWFIIVPLGLLFLYILKLPAIWIAIFLHMDEMTSFPFKLHHYIQYKWLRKIT